MEIIAEILDTYLYTYTGPIVPLLISIDTDSIDWIIASSVYFFSEINGLWSFFWSSLSSC